MKNLFLLLLLLGQAEPTEQPIKRIDLTIYVNERNVVEHILKISLTEKWIDRLNPILKNDLSAIELSESLDKRVSELKDKLGFKFIDRDRYDTGQPFGFSIGNSFRIYKLPTSNLMAESGYWLELFEYIEEELNWEDRHEIWKTAADKVKQKFYAEEFAEKVKFLEQYIVDNPGWFCGKGCGIFDDKGNFKSAEDLGYKSPVVMRELPKEPLRPKSPFEKLFILHEKNAPEMKILLEELPASAEEPEN